MANCAGEESDELDWNTDDDLEITGMPTLPAPAQEPSPGNCLLDEGASSSNRNLMSYFTSMGFSEDLVEKAIRGHEEGTEDSILERILTYAAPDSPQLQQHADSNLSSSDYDEGILDDFSDSDSLWGEEECKPPESEDETLSTLGRMGYTKEEISIAMERCGQEAAIEVLTDFILAAQVARADDVNWAEVSENKPKTSDMYYANGRLKKRKPQYPESNGRKKERGPDLEPPLRLPKPMIGFNIPAELMPDDAPPPIFCREIHEKATGPPYFYYENVALAPKGVWDTITRFLYDIQPEFVDSKYFCAANRKRAYIHNLPVDNRFPLVPLPPRTINEALPLTKRWWPAWDTRTKLNCLQTAIASAKLTERIRKALEQYGDEPPEHVVRFVMEQCKKWNLVWVGKHKTAPLEPDEVELLLGFPRNHTRGGGISRTDRYKSLGNSFQVDTVAYHLSVLKAIFPQGINVLSLFSGIGGAEVALHRLGVPLRNVVSVEKSEVNRNIVRSWWGQTNQQGHLIDFDDIQLMTGRKLQELMVSIGGFHLVIGGSPCNNLAGSNRVSRDGLEGKESALFFDYFRILDSVVTITRDQN